MAEYLNNNKSGFQEFRAMKEKEPQKGFGFLGWMVLFLAAYWMFAPAKKEAPDQKPALEQIDVSDVTRQTLVDGKIAATIQGLRISNINLNDYKIAKDEIENIELLSEAGEFIEIGFVADGTNVPAPSTLWKTPRIPVGSTMSWRSDAGVDFRRTVTGGGDYVITVKDEIRNNGKKPVSVSQYARIVRRGGEASRFAVKTGGILNNGGDIETEDWDDIANGDAGIRKSAAGRPAFVGFSDQYWETVVSTKDTAEKTMELDRRGDVFIAEMRPKSMTAIEPGKTAVLTSEIFAGPKTQDALLTASGKIPGVDSTLDYGTFGFLTRPFLWTLVKLYDIIPNYGIAIIILTLIIRGLMWPLTKKSFKSMAAMQKVQPEMTRIQKLYADDKARLQQEIMRLYQTHKANPFAGIGFMFLQIPIFFALYKALLIAVPLRHAAFLWLPDLSVKDPYFILPLLMAAAMWLQNRLSRADSAHAPGMAVMKYMPFVFAAMFAFMSSGLVLYWTVSSMVGIIQLWIMKRGEK